MALLSQVLLLWVCGNVIKVLPISMYCIEQHIAIYQLFAYVISLHVNLLHVIGWSLFSI